jgi:hypothetical protein
MSEVPEFDYPLTEDDIPQEPSPEAVRAAEQHRAQWSADERLAALREME